MAFCASGSNPFTYLQETPMGLRTTRARGDSIVAAVERWRARTGSYPVNLGLLVPGDLPAILPPAVGDGTWQYTTHPSKGYTLKFWVGPDYECEWRDRGGKDWMVNR